MDECNGSIPEGRQGKIRSVTCWLQATAVSGWGWGTYLLHGVQSLQRRILVFLRRYWLLLFGGLTLLLAIRIQYALPQWYVSGVQFLQANLLIVGTVVLLLLFLFVWKVPKWQVANIPDEKDRLATESGFRQTFVQIVGGAALLGGLYFTAQTLRTSQETLRVNQKTLETTQQGQITERFTRAIEQLGDKERLMVRLGGIYALERIAQDSTSDHWVVMEVLMAFVREQAPAKTMPSDNTSEEKDTKESLPERKPPLDIQAILTVIGRRTRTFQNGETRRLDLHNTNLQGANLGGAQLQAANLMGAQLQGANLAGAQLKTANLTRAQLQGANLAGAQLQSTSLMGAQLQGAHLPEAQLQRAALAGAQLQKALLPFAQLQGAFLMDADLREAYLNHALLSGAFLQYARLSGAQLQGADLTAVSDLTQDQIDKACLDENTQLPEGLTRPTPCPMPQLTR